MPTQDPSPRSHRQPPRSAGTTLLAIALVLGTAACGSKSKPPPPAAAAETEPKPPLPHGLTEEQAAKVIAKIGDTSITLGQFADRLGDQSPYLRARYTSAERRREFLDNMVRFELLAAEAKKRGLDKQPDVDRVRRQMMVQQMMKEMFDDKGVKLSDITEAEIKAYYDANPTEFHKPAQRRASHILFKDKQKAQAALNKLLGAGAGSAKAPIHTKASATGTAPEAPAGDTPDDMELFRKLAKDLNQDAETKDRLGDLRFFSQTPATGEVAPPKAVRDAVFGLAKTGDVAPEVIASEQGFHIVKLTGERAALDRSLDDARRLIQNRLWRQKREAAIEKFVDGLRAKAQVKENLDLLSQVKVNVDPAVGGEGEASAAAPAKASGSATPTKTGANAAPSAKPAAKPTSAPHP